MKTVLLVDDEPGVRSLCRQFLAPGPYTVLEANDGREALEVCRRHEGPIHLLLTDLVMPGMSGLELARQVAAARPETCILFMSASAEASIKEELVGGAPRPWLHKPFTQQALLAAVRDTLG